MPERGGLQQLVKLSLFFLRIGEHDITLRRIQKGPERKPGERVGEKGQLIETSSKQLYIHIYIYMEPRAISAQPRVDFPIPTLGWHTMGTC